MDSAKMMTDAYNLRKAIETEIVEVEENGIKIIMSGDLRIKQIFLDSSENDVLRDVINMAIRQVQEMTVLKMQEIVDLQNIS